MSTILITSQSSALGGVERRLLSEVRVLRELGADVLVSVPRFPGILDFEAAVERAGGELYSWNPYKFIERQHCIGPLALLNRLFAIPLLSKKVAFASVPLPWTTVGLSRAWVLQQARIPYALSFRCTYSQARISEATRSRIRETLSGVVGAYGVSQTARDSFLDNFGDLIPKGVAIPIIRNGVDLTRFGYSSVLGDTMRRSLGFEKDDFVIASCGRLDPLKRPELILAAFHALAQLNDRARLVMLGDGPLRAELMEQARLGGIADRLRMIPFSDDVPAIYSGCDAYLSPSLVEGSPSAAIEALAASLPIVVTDNAAYRESFSGCNATTFVTEEDPAVWAAHLQRIAALGPEQRAKLRAAALEFAHAHYSQARMLSELREYFSALLEKYVN